MGSKRGTKMVNKDKNGEESPFYCFKTIVGNFSQGGFSAVVRTKATLYFFVTLSFGQVGEELRYKNCFKYLKKKTR